MKTIKVFSFVAPLESSENLVKASGIILNKYLGSFRLT